MKCYKSCIYPGVRSSDSAAIAAPLDAAAAGPLSPERAASGCTTPSATATFSTETSWFIALYDVVQAHIDLIDHIAVRNKIHTKITQLNVSTSTSQKNRFNDYQCNGAEVTDRLRGSNMI